MEGNKLLWVLLKRWLCLHAGLIVINLREMSVVYLFLVYLLWCVAACRFHFIGVKGVLTCLSAICFRQYFLVDLIRWFDQRCGLSCCITSPLIPHLKNENKSVTTSTLNTMTSAKWGEKWFCVFAQIQNFVTFVSSQNRWVPVITQVHVSFEFPNGWGVYIIIMTRDLIVKE